MRFFKWLYNPDIEQNERPKPSVIENIPQLKRKEKSIYKPTDLWTQEDDSLFLKYCPNPRDRCYHAMSRDSAARPHELLKLRIKDVVFKLTPDKKQYAEILVNGKTGTGHIPLIDSIPYIKEWISQHPHGLNPNSILLCGFGRSLNRVIHVRSLHKTYLVYKSKFFPKLLDNPNVLPEGLFLDMINTPQTCHQLHNQEQARLQKRVRLILLKRLKKQTIYNNHLT
jgi:integrase